MPSHHIATRGRRSAKVFVRMSKCPESISGRNTLRVELSQGLTTLHFTSGCQKILLIIDPTDIGCILSVI